ncbi:MAG TPA: phosphoribosylamine--glycine ligase [Burkholderiaceae bacterium]|nr:phosphoribosylamine--glycine ligase [Burkholderiaceae bacterium]
MKLLVIGSGGREHALAWRLAQSERVQKVFVAPGNGGTAQALKMQNAPLNTVDEWLQFAQQENITFAVVGPEAPLAAGVVDAFRAAGIKIFGPSKAAAQLESSKDFAKAFMVRHGIPTAAYQTFNDAESAKNYVSDQGAPIVVKADGLAAGKGVTVATSVAEAHDAIDKIFLDNIGASTDGSRVVIEEYLEGEEASFIALCDREHVLPLATSQDHKRLLDGDQGPNTGGMGAYSPAPVITPDLHNRIMQEVIRPTLKGMLDEGLPFTGFLYAGLMIGEGSDADRTLKVLEYNCRMGDPEGQPIMMRVRSDLATVFELALDGKLDQAEIEWDRRTALGVVMAAKNYPDTPRTGDTIHIPENTDDCLVFHGGTKLDGEVLKTAGGRVLCVTALGDSVKRAQAKAYRQVHLIDFDGQQYRNDIGWRALRDQAESSS